MDTNIDKKALTKEEEVKRRKIYKGRYLCRMIKTEKGNYEDETKTTSEGKIVKAVYPYTLQRAEKNNFRELALIEVDEHFANIRKDRQLPYDVIERKLRETEENLAKHVKQIENSKDKKIETMQEIANALKIDKK